MTNKIIFVWGSVPTDDIIKYFGNAKIVSLDSVLFIHEVFPGDNGYYVKEFNEKINEIFESNRGKEIVVIFSNERITSTVVACISIAATIYNSSIFIHTNESEVYFYNFTNIL